MTQTEQEVTHTLHKVIADILPGTGPEQIHPDKHLRDLGADSVDRVEIIVQVTDLLGIDLPLSNFGSLRDIRELVDYLVRSA
ncbi:acyl carrier protein [Amycolatopsis alba]|uniref:acyl carrier protein n=1 Tax=Amycolatopsis alba TaxID=76020 RepID=UPI00036A22FE|nr:phosphopantetheine-binding protein [Amycolatopsis alba]